jgi:potassium-dependent mechanosensitive channel
MEFTNNTTTITSQEFVHKLVSLLTTTLFKLGDIKISFSFVINLVIQTLIVVLIARVVKEITKNRILNRFGLDIGTREALSSVNHKVSFNKRKSRKYVARYTIN